LHTKTLPKSNLKGNAISLVKSRNNVVIHCYVIVFYPYLLSLALQEQHNLNLFEPFEQTGEIWCIIFAWTLAALKRAVPFLMTAKQCSLMPRVWQTLCS